MALPNDQVVNALKGQQHQGPIPTLRPSPQRSPMEDIRHQMLMSKLLKESQPQSMLPTPGYGQGFDTSNFGSYSTGLLSNLRAAYNPSNTSDTTSDTSTDTTNPIFSALRASTGSLGASSPISTRSASVGLSGSALSPDFMAQIARIESGGNPNLGWNRSGNRGLYQFGPEEEKKYGLNASNWNDPVAQQQALGMEMKELSHALSSRGIDITPANLYLAHQQGIGGGPALLQAHPDMPAWQAVRPFYGSDRVAQSAISNNIYQGMPGYGKPVDQITAGEFRTGWANKFGNSPQQLPSSSMTLPSLNDY